MEKLSHKTATIGSLPTNQLGRVPVRRVSDPTRHAAPWELTIYVGGKRKRSFHPTEAAAVKAWREHKRLEKKYGTLPHLFDAEAQRSYDTALHLLGGEAEDVALEDAVRYYLAHAPKKKAPLLSTAIETFVAEKRKLGRSAVHVHDLHVVLRAFARDHAPATATVATVGPAHVRAYVLTAKAARTASNRRNILAAFFAWCRRQGWISATAAPTASLAESDMPSPRLTPKAILSPAQARALFAEFARQAPECLPWLAVQAFAGIRDAEAARLGADMVDHERQRLRIPAAICKTADDWVLARLPANLWAWLPREGLAFVEVRKKRWAAIKRALAALPADDAGRIPSWPYNALRRSFCTYHISEHGDATATAMLLRHSSPKRLYASYLGALRTEEEAAEYFSITPDNT